MNHKFGDPAIPTLLRGGNPTCLPCPDRPGLCPHLQRSPQALLASQTRSRPQARPLWPRTTREWARGKDWGPDFAGVGGNGRTSHSAAPILFD